MVKKKRRSTDIIPVNATSLELRRIIIDLKQELAKAKIRERILKNLAYNDHLTQIFNRSGLAKAFKETLKSPIGVFVYIDIDEFKNFNDREDLGHHVGDQVLQHVAKSLNGFARDTDVVARYGGDEFVIIFDGMPAEQAEQKRLELKTIFEDLHIIYNEERLEIEASIGIKSYNQGDDIEEVKQLADQEMFDHKRAKGHSPRQS